MVMESNSESLKLGSFILTTNKIIVINISLSLKIHQWVKLSSALQILIIEI
jgi:hypothetical protein